MQGAIVSPIFSCSRFVDQIRLLPPLACAACGKKISLPNSFQPRELFRLEQILSHHLKHESQKDQDTFDHHEADFDGKNLTDEHFGLVKLFSS